MMRLSEVNVVCYGNLHCHDYDLGWLPAELLALWRLKGKTWAKSAGRNSANQVMDVIQQARLMTCTHMQQAFCCLKYQQSNAEDGGNLQLVQLICYAALRGACLQPRGRGLFIQE